MILHFTNARLIDPEAGTDAPGSLLVRDGRVEGVGALTEAAPELATGPLPSPIWTVSYSVRRPSRLAARIGSTNEA